MQLSDYYQGHGLQADLRMGLKCHVSLPVASLTLFLLQISGSRELAVPLSSHPLARVLDILEAQESGVRPGGEPPLAWPRVWIHEVDTLGLGSPVIGTLFH